MAYNTSITVSLDLERDRDILAWLERQENRSSAVRDVLRAYIQNSTTLGDLLRLLERIDRHVETGVVSTKCTSSEGYDPGLEVTSSRFTAALETLAEKA